MSVTNYGHHLCIHLHDFHHVKKLCSIQCRFTLLSRTVQSPSHRLAIENDVCSTSWMCNSDYVTFDSTWLDDHHPQTCSSLNIQCGNFPHGFCSCAIDGNPVSSFTEVSTGCSILWNTYCWWNARQLKAIIHP